MNTIILAFFILLDIFYYLIIFHIILSWLTLFGLKIKITFIDELINPIYKIIRKYIPTRIWPFDFTPIIILFILIFIRWIIMVLFPELSNIALNTLS